MLTQNIEKLSQLFLKKHEIPLFSDLPYSELSSIEQDDGVNKDSLVSKLNDLTNLIDRINKRDFDKITGLKTKGTKECLINILKYTFKDSHDYIGNIKKNLDMIFLLRGYYTHKRNKNIKVAFDMLEINAKSEVEEIWLKSKSLFNETISGIIQLFEYKKDEILQEKIDSEMSTILLKMFMGGHESELNDPKYNKYVTFLLTNKNVIDTDMAKTFNIPIEELRNDLLLFYPLLLEMDYHDMESTRINLKDIFVESLKEYFWGDDNEA